MGILLQFPSPDDPNPESPSPSLCMPRPAEPALTNAVSVLVLTEPLERKSAPLSLLLALRVIAYPTYTEPLPAMSAGGAEEPGREWYAMSNTLESIRSSPRFAKRSDEMRRYR